jgi:PhnB protein
MATVNIYLNFNGNCEEAFNFYKSVMGGEFSYVGRFGEMPPQEGQPPLPPEMKNLIMHIGLPVSKETSLMGSDTGGEWAPSYIQGNNFSVSINTDSKAEADKLFNGLSEGGNVTMPMDKTFWGAYFGMFTDKFGINWMVNFDEQPK